MEKAPINKEFAEAEALRIELMKNMDEILQPTAVERREAMDTVLQNLINSHEVGELSQDDLNYATNLWLDQYPLED